MLVVLHEPVLGGATLSVLRTLPLLRERGWRFLFWAPRPSELDDRLREDGWEVHGAKRTVSYSLAALRLPPGPRRRLAAMPAYFGELRRLVAERRPALAHVNSLTTLAEAATLRASGVPVVAHIHEMLGTSLKAQAARAGIRGVAAEAIGVSGACSAALAIGSWHPHVVHEGALYPEEVPDRTHRPGRAPLIVSVGVISRRKGSDLFVAAAGIVREQRPDTRFMIVGSPTDPLDAEWAEAVLLRAREHGVEHRSRADIPALLEEADVFVLPSRVDPCPIALLEAMGSGLAVVGTAVDGIPEELDGGGAGELVAPEDPAVLASAILRLLDDPERRARLGSAARKRATTHYSVERQALGIEAVWLEALDQ